MIGAERALTPGAASTQRHHAGRARARPTLFLDFDGVLHPMAFRDGDTFKVGETWHATFERAPTLDQALAGIDVRIVLATSWVRAEGLRRARGHLPPGLAAKVTGTTYHVAVDRAWCASSRWTQVYGYVYRHRIQNWIAIDDDASGWPLEQRHRLMKIDREKGITDREIALLRENLKSLAQGP